MPVRWEGPKASYHGNIDKPPVTCTPNPKRDASVPTLAQMTEKAIDLLSRNEKGFFLQVEGASIDKQDHAANPCGQIGETVDLDEAVQKALEFAKKDGNTLVIVTADHAHASQIIPADSKAPGLTQALNTQDGAVMVMSYGNSEEESMEHTGTQLRIAAYGPHAANVVGLTDQTDPLLDHESGPESQISRCRWRIRVTGWFFFYLRPDLQRSTHRRMVR